MFSSIVHISPTTSLVVGTNPPAHPQWHDAVLDLHAHEYTAVHTRGQHPFSPFHISLLCVFMCIVGTWNMLRFLWIYSPKPPTKLGYLVSCGGISYENMAGTSRMGYWYKV